MGQDSPEDKSANEFEPTSFFDDRTQRLVTPGTLSIKAHSKMAASLRRAGASSLMIQCQVCFVTSGRFRNLMSGDLSMRNVVIIGSGCAGLTAAIYAARANLKPLVLEGHEPGGQLSLTTHVENFPGFPDGIMGPELIENMKRQAERFGTEFKSGAVTEVDIRQRPFTITVNGEKHQTKTLIVAAGASARLLGLKGEKELIGRGVSTCATCDGYFFRGKPIAVVGGGDSAMEEANFLSRYASKVYLIHRRQEFRASKIMIDRTKANPKVEFLVPYVVDEILSPQGLVNGVRVRNAATSETKEIELDGVFVAIGHDPNSTVFQGKLEMDQNGYLLAKHGSISNVPGVFIAGDVQDHRYRQAVTAAGSGCMAAIDAEKFLEEHKDA
jgi:thioredoxin reductase (NADPH)